MTAATDDTVHRNAAWKAQYSNSRTSRVVAKARYFVYEGAKLIVRIMTTSSCGDMARIMEVGKTVVVEGVLKKEQRRTFLEAARLRQIVD